MGIHIPYIYLSIETPRLIQWNSLEKKKRYPLVMWKQALKMNPIHLLLHFHHSCIPGKKPHESAMTIDESWPNGWFFPPMIFPAWFPTMKCPSIFPWSHHTKKTWTHGRLRPRPCRPKRSEDSIPTVEGWFFKPSKIIGDAHHLWIH